MDGSRKLGPPASGARALASQILNLSLSKSNDYFGSLLLRNKSSKTSYSMSFILLMNLQFGQVWQEEFIFAL